MNKFLIRIVSLFLILGLLAGALPDAALAFHSRPAIPAGFAVYTQEAFANALVFARSALSEAAFAVRQKLRRNPTVLQTIVLTDPEVERYFGRAILEKAHADRRRFYIRQLHPEEDTHWIDGWQNRLNADPEWQVLWREAAAPHPADQLPFFVWLAATSLGLFSEADGQTRLEGHIGGELESGGSFYIGQMENYYRNIPMKSRPADLPGVSSVLFDVLLKWIVESGSFSMVHINALSPGSKAFSKRQGFDSWGADAYGWQSGRLQQAYARRGLDGRFKTFENVLPQSPEQTEAIRPLKELEDRLTRGDRFRRMSA